MLRHGVLDTGADDAVFPDSIATAVRLDLTHAEQWDVALSVAGRSVVALCAPSYGMVGRDSSS